MTTEEMKALGRVAIQAWNEGRPDLLDKVYAPTYRNHFNGETLDMLKQSLLATRTAFSGFTLTIDDQIVEGDKGVTRWTARGVHTGSTSASRRPAGRLRSRASTLAALRTARSSTNGRAGTMLVCCASLACCPDAPAMSSDAGRDRARLFMLRVWPEVPGAAATVWRGKVQSLPDGEAYYFRTWEGLIAHLQAMLQAGSAGSISSGTQHRNQ